MAFIIDGSTPETPKANNQSDLSSLHRHKSPQHHEFSRVLLISLPPLQFPDPPSSLPHPQAPVSGFLWTLEICQMVLQLFFTVAFSAVPLTLYVPPIRSLNLFVETMEDLLRESRTYTHRVYPRVRHAWVRMVDCLLCSTA